MKAKHYILFFLVNGIAFVCGAMIGQLIEDRELLNAAFEQVDRNINVQFAGRLNKEFITADGYQFGDKKHTISYVIGRNRITKTLSPKGRAIDRFLDRIQLYHTLRSVKHEEGRCDSVCKRPYVDHF